MSSNQALVLHAPRDLRLEERAVTPPGVGEVLVRIERGGICGSDLHYYNHGGFGAVRLKQPMTLGHEISGRIERLGSDVQGLSLGDAVAVNPSIACGHCKFCRMGQPIHCLDMRFLGSAMRTPHIQGGFSQFLTMPARNAVPLPPGCDVTLGAFAEPMAVALHAIQTTPVVGQRVLIMGAGPIGVLLVLAARYAGAREIVVTDIEDAPLKFAAKAGADRVINTKVDPSAFESFAADKGYLDVAFEAAGQGATVVAALDVIRPQGVLVLVGQGATAELPVSKAVTKEIQLRGSFRFDAEFELAVHLIGSKRLDVMPLLSGTLPMAEATQAFQLANDKSKSMKVQIAFA